MHRVVAAADAGERDVYDLTVEGQHNFIVFTTFMTPLLVHNCSHGAGRRLSRTAAKKQRSVEDVIESLRAKGIELAKRGHADVAEEAGHAYKDVDPVLRDSADLVEPVYRLRPLGVMKG